MNAPAFITRLPTAASNAIRQQRVDHTLRSSQGFIDDCWIGTASDLVSAGIVEPYMIPHRPGPRFVAFKDGTRLSKCAFGAGVTHVHRMRGPLFHVVKGVDHSETMRRIETNSPGGLHRRMMYVVK
jgi:hypothetical protein